MDEIDKAGESFMGMLKADEPDAVYFLFFLKGDAYAAGCIRNDKPMPISIAVEAEKEEKALRIRIEVTDGPQKGNKFNVPLPCTIGRRDATIRIRDMTVSKTHAALEVSEGKIIFRDLDSTNGSIVNGKAVKETELSNGDIVQMGNTTLKIHFVTS